jgi:myosin heavy subunit
LEVVAKLLGVKADALNSALTTRAMSVSGQKIMLNLKPEQATDTRDALAKVSTLCSPPPLTPLLVK